MFLFDKNKRILKKYSKMVEKINHLDESMRSKSNEELIALSKELKEKINSLEDADKNLLEAFALVREVARRTVGMRPFDVQVMGGIALHEGKVAEMKTGEGKTLAATMPIYLNALIGKGVHLVTVNDYLARRDALWMGPIYLFLGLRVGVINSLGKSYEVVWKNPDLAEKAIKENWSVWPENFNGEVLDDEHKNIEATEAFQVELKEITRKEAYLCDVTYGTNNEFGFDYLRDNLVLDYNDKVQRGHFYAIVDEADSVLIDEARTPLIISGPSKESPSTYRKFAQIAKKFVKDKDFTVDEKARTIILTEEGIAKAERIIGVDNLYEPGNVSLLYHLINALKALHLFKKDVDYVVMNGEVIIVDEFTGRLLPGRRYSGGLHQAIEAKEGVPIKEESITYATITFQNYFRMYEKLAGMTGTAKTEENEFVQVYGMEVVVIPTHKPMIRKDHDDLVFRTQREKYEKIVEEIEKRYKKGQPVLVGTTSIEKSELLSSMLKKKGIPHQVLNAKHHEKEAEIVAKAGQKGMVTIATNMAGRGTDIKLGPGVAELGGLCVIGTERHESRRIDNQLRGRSGRQGDPGESIFFLSLEDDLLRIFGGEQIGKVMNILKIEEGQPIQHPMLSKLIENIQKKVEGINFSIRKTLMEMDEVLDKQRSAIYSLRDQILLEEDYDEYLRQIFEDVVSTRVEEFCSGKNWDLEGLKNSLSFFPKGLLDFEGKRFTSSEEVYDYLLNRMWDEYQRKKHEIGEEYKRVIKFLMLRIIDEHWRRYLEEVEHVKEAVQLRSYGQKDPIVEFKKETYFMFDEMMRRINDTIANYVLRVVKVSEKDEKEAKEELGKIRLVHEEFNLVNRAMRRAYEKKKKSGTHGLGKIRVKR
ncbi:preprotein translocase subunit SecA [Thermotoga sp. KOL6]|uniref:preprotein translocase subunit SecA n=1 Tax=Thermotoga sp. KOL6 TaxID=126741 RepID=UPI000C77F77F|nr:preprotein translocase subunit SecA [Thermotoga sp. KOL6]PLV60509.1 preprotein translocase subunit SecA [Thermotoga sp. KOL6]